MNRLFTILTLLTLTLAVCAQQKTREQQGGVYYAYPVNEDVAVAAAPAGYTPFYLSHYGRHGSRWLPSDSRYEWVLAQMQSHQLTKEGKRVLRKLGKVWKNARGNGGQLTPLGARQHRGIASRMARRFPEVFVRDAVVSVRSSVVNRCRESMLHFTRQLSADCPGLRVTAVTDSADMRYIAYTTPQAKRLEQRKFAQMHGSPQRLMRLLFTDPASVAEPVRLLSELHTIASDMQDVPLAVDLYSLFTDEEFADVYACNNERMAFCNGVDPLAYGEAALSAVTLWQNIEACADKAIGAGVPAADLRFGHDTNLYRLLSLMQASSAASGQMDEILPMAANLQMAFYRNASGDVLVRLLHNERDITIPVAETAPCFYRWSAVKDYMADRIHRLMHLRQLASLNTMVGTAEANTLSAGLFGKGSEEHGQTLPAVLTPNGQNFWTPQTRDTEKKCVAPYYYADTLLQGVRNSHWIVGGCTQDYGSFTLAALGGSLRTAPDERATPFSHRQEVSHPHYYGVELPHEHLRLELTATAHGAVVRITPHRDQLVHLIFQPNSDEGEGSVAIDTLARTVYGTNPVHRIYQGWGEAAGFSGHLLLRYDGRPVAFGCYDGSGRHEGQTAIGRQADLGAWLTFEGKAGVPIVLTAASSFTGLEGCRRNSDAELSGRTFDEVMAAAAEAWTDRLHTIDVESADTAAVNQFYGALYRASFLPRLLSDADHAYPRFADGTPVKGSRPRYTDFSMWDTYRALHPLYCLIAPSMSADMMQSLVEMGEEGGWLPIFPCWNSYTAAMIGDHCAATLADAYVKGIDGFDAERAYRLMRKNAFETPASKQDYADGMGRRALTSYLRYGYIPMEDPVKEAFHNDEQTSRTLEYAFDDFAVAQMARLLGHDDDYRQLMRRAGNWRNVINPRTGYADGRHADGRFEGNTDLDHRKSYITEGATCHYTWYVPHDPQGLIALLGGPAPFAARLDSLFALGRYWHGNEPCHQVPYMFGYAGRADLTQRWVRHIMRTEYNDTPGGLSGNDDAGQMSAWYVFSAMGFYPVCPATPQYMLGSPLFRRVTIHRPGGRPFTIEADDNSDTNIYIGSATLDGRPVADGILPHEAIVGGGTLRLKMTSTTDHQP